MAKWGACDFKQLVALQKRMEQLERTDLDAFCRSCAQELAARLLALVIPRTPVGVYEDKLVSFTTRDGKQVSFWAKANKTGGNLRRSWTTRDGLRVVKEGDTYTITIENSALYASYVEFGHRTANHKGWVRGKFMLTISEQQLQTRLPQILERKLKVYLEKVINGG